MTDPCLPRVTQSEVVGLAATLARHGQRGFVPPGGR